MIRIDSYNPETTPTPDRKRDNMEEVENPRAKAFLHSGGSFYSPCGHYFRGHNYMNWVQERWREWEKTVKDDPEYQRRSHRSLNHRPFDLWLQTNYGTIEWYINQYGEEHA